MTDVARDPAVTELRVVDRVRARPAVAVLVPLMVIAMAVFMWAGRGLTFYFDEWDFIVDRQTWTASAFLSPHGEHLVAVPVLVYKVLFATAGLAHYWVYRLVVLVLHLACVLLVFAYARRRVPWWVAVALATVLLFLGSGWEVILWPFQITLLGSIVSGLGALLLLERPRQRNDIAACVLLVVGIACSGVGLSFIAAAVVGVLLRREWGRLWIPALSALVYLIWYSQWSEGVLAGASPSVNFFASPGYIASAFTAVVGGITGLGAVWATPLAVALAAWVVYELVRGRGSVGIAVLLAAALTYWFLTALARAQLNDSGSSRYVYVGAVFVLLMLAELLQTHASPWPRSPVIAAVAVAVVVAVIGNLGALRPGLAQLRTFTQSVQGDLVAVDAAGGRANPNLQLDPMHAPNIYVGPYQSAVARWGSPAESLAAFERRPEPEREAADAVLFQLLGVALHATPSRPRAVVPPVVEAAHWGTVVRAGSCLRFDPTAPGAAVDLTVVGGGLALRPARHGTTQLALHELASDYPAPDTALVVPARTWSTLRLPRTPKLGPWHARVFATDTVDICTLSATP